MARSAAALALCAALAGCALFAPPPPPSTPDNRLAVFPTEGAPLQGRVRIHWDEHQIPFIEAEHDRDAAVALGMVHAHLRLGMIQVVRHAAQGRLSEMIGFPASTSTGRSAPPISTAPSPR